MFKKTLLGFSVFSSIVLGAESEHIKNGFGIEAGAEIFNKFGLTPTQKSPTDSYGYVLGEINADYKFSKNQSFFQVKLGFVGAGLTSDSTNKNSLDNSLGYNYIGYWAGYNGLGQANASNAKNYSLHNAYGLYQNESFKFIIGRSESDDDNYLQIYTEGIHADLKLGDGGFFKFNAVSTMALIGSGWLWDYSFSYQPKGLLHTEVGFEGERIKASVFYYYGIDEYHAPGADLSLTFENPYSGFSSTTRLNAIVPMYNDVSSWLMQPLLIGVRPNFNGGTTATLLLKQDFKYQLESSAFKAGLSLLKHLGFSYARIGLFGSPIGINIWDSSVYGIGPSLNGIAAPDAFNVLIHAGYEKEFGFKWLKGIDTSLLGRYTTSTSIEEYSLILTSEFNFNEQISFKLIANYYTSIALNPAFFNGQVAKGAAVDRSYVMTQLNFKY